MQNGSFSMIHKLSDTHKKTIKPRSTNNSYSMTIAANDNHAQAITPYSSIMSARNSVSAITEVED